MPCIRRQKNRQCALVTALFLFIMGSSNYATYMYIVNANNRDIQDSEMGKGVSSENEVVHVHRAAKIPLAGNLQQVDNVQRAANIPLGGNLQQIANGQRAANVHVPLAGNVRQVANVQKAANVPLAGNAQPAPSNKLFSHRLMLPNLKDYSDLRIVFNRVPKTGSLALKKVLHKMTVRYLYHKLFVYTLPDAMEQLSSAKQLDFASFVNGTPTPSISVKHIYFVDFGRFHVPRPMYINVVREPLDRAVSFYYFRINGRTWKKQRQLLHYKNMTLDDCVAPALDGSENGEPCAGLADLRNGQLRFFCGNDDECNTYDERALAIAKANVEKHYSVIGLYEDMTSFLEVLKVMMPPLFEHLPAVYNNMTEDLYSYLTTAKKILPSEETAEYVKTFLSLEYDFYYFVQKRFHELKASLLR